MRFQRYSPLRLVVKRTLERTHVEVDFHCASIITRREWSNKCRISSAEPGQLGDETKESAQAAVSYARSRAESLGIDPDFHAKHDIHIHVPAGGIPKDGPSAGVTIATSLISALTHTPVNKAVAMTGEITLRGRVLPIGGLKEKTLAAHRAGIRTLILPAKNRADLEELPPKIRRSMTFVPVESMDEVLATALVAKEKGAGTACEGGPAKPETGGPA